MVQSLQQVGECLELLVCPHSRVLSLQREHVAAQKKILAHQLRYSDTSGAPWQVDLQAHCLLAHS